VNNNSAPMASTRTVAPTFHTHPLIKFYSGIPTCCGSWGVSDVSVIKHNLNRPPSLELRNGEMDCRSIAAFHG
jgi:hypothetical protein